MKGTVVICVVWVIILKSSVASAPVLAGVASATLIGVLRASVISSCIVLALSDGCTVTTKACAPTMVSGAKSVSTL